MKTTKILLATLVITLFALPSYAQLKVDADGKVGVGTTTPSQPLEVNGNVKSNGNFILHGSGAGTGEASVLTGFQRGDAGSAAIRFYNAPGNFGSWGTTFGLDNVGGGGLFHKGNGTLGIVTLNTQSVGFGVNNAEKMRIQGSDGFVGINTLTPGFQFEVQGDAAKPGGGDWAMTSDRRTKKDIRPFEDGLDEVLKLNPVVYKYNGEGGVRADGKEYVGVIAQEIQEVAPYTVKPYTHREIVTEMKDGAFMPTERVVKEEEYLSVDATAIRYMLVNAVKEHQKMIEEKDARINELEERLEKLERMVMSLNNTGTGTINSQTIDLSNPDGVLMQNQPNPFNQSTKIVYALPKDTRSAMLRVMDMSGRVIKQEAISTDAGRGEVMINAGELSPGTYSYSLIVNGSVLMTKQMVLTR